MKDVLKDLLGLIFILPLIIIIYIWAGIEWLREIRGVREPEQ